MWLVFIGKFRLSDCLSGLDGWMGEWVSGWVLNTVYSRPV